MYPAFNSRNFFSMAAAIIINVLRLSYSDISEKLISEVPAPDGKNVASV